MNKKGFTLIEMLAVIALLGLILFIAVPNIIGTYNSSKKSTFKINVEKLYDAVEVYKNEYELLYGRVLINASFEIIDGSIINNPLSLKGKLPDSGNILIDEHGQISLIVYDNGLCGRKKSNDSEVVILEITKDECKIK